MQRNEWIGVAALIAVCVVVFAVLWMRDPQHRLSAQLPAAATPAGPPTLSAGSLLVTMPGLESQAAENPAVVLCQPAEAGEAQIERAMKIADGTLYLDVQVRPRCGGWTPADQVQNYPAWLDDIKIGPIVEL